jgi:uncharacterized protein (DUF1501 family)
MRDLPSLNSLDRRQFLGLLAAALGTSTAGVLKVLDDGGHGAKRGLAGGTLHAAEPGAPSAAPGPTTSAPGPASAAGGHANHAQRGEPAAAGSTVAPPTPLPLDQRTLVLITLYGGNDSMNMLVPYQDSRYYGMRGPLAVPAPSVLPLGDGLGLHPNLASMRDRWNAQEMAVVRGVGYPNFNRSHFVSMAIWQTASVSTPVPTGWLGRWLDTARGNDPARALVIGSSVPTLLRGARASAGAIPSGPFTVPGGPTGLLDRSFRTMMVPSNGQSTLQQTVAQNGGDMESLSQMLAGDLGNAGAAAQVPPALEADAGAVGDSLDVVARLINAGADTKVYSVSMGGFDTHANQPAIQPNLFTQLDTALRGFWSAIANHPRRNGIVVAVYSEFGRRVLANGSSGTDHGKAGHVFLFGAPVKAGFHGDEPDLGRLLYGDLAPTTDFRSIYGSLLSGVIGFNPAASLGPGAPAPLDLIR